MTTQIREALTAVHDAVRVAPPDHLAFQSRVRAERRRRAGRRAAAGLAAAVVVGLVGAVAGGGLGNGERATDVADNRPAPSRPASVPVSLEGRLALVDPDGSVRRSDVRVEDVVGATAAGVVVVDRDSHLLLVPVRGGGDATAFGRPRDLTGAPVQSAHLDKGGLFLAFVDLDGTIHFREVGARTDYQSGEVPPGEQVLGIDGGGWTTYSAGQGLVLHHRDQEQQEGAAFVDTQIGTGFPADTAELADMTLAVGTSDGVEVFEAHGAPRLGGSLGGEVSSLAPGGDVVATATGSDQADGGMSVGVWLLDAFSGDQVPLRGYDAGPAVDLAWVDDDEFAVLAGRGNDELWVCSAPDRRCERRLTAAAGELRLPTR